MNFHAREHQLYCYILAQTVQNIPFHFVNSWTWILSTKCVGLWIYKLCLDRKVSSLPPITQEPPITKEPSMTQGPSVQKPSATFRTNKPWRFRKRKQIRHVKGMCLHLSSQFWSKIYNILSYNIIIISYKILLALVKIWAYRSKALR